MEKLFQSVEQIGTILNKHTQQDEQSGRLSKPVISALRNTGLYRLFLPASLGGMEADPLTVAKLVEKVAHYNAAAGWSVMVASAGNWWSRCLPAEGVEEIFIHSPEFFAAAISPPMKAERTKGGYIINGQSPLCSNVHEAGWVGASSMVMENRQPVMNNGRPEIRLVVMKADDCRIIDTWYALGMNATDSHDVAAENVFVPEHRTYIISLFTENNKHYKGNLYHFPVAGINGCCLIVPVAIAVAANAVEELKKLTEKIPTGSVAALKEKGSFQKKLAMAEALVRSARIYLHQTLTDVWNKVLSGEAASSEDKAALLLAASHANKSCVEAVDLVYNAAGTAGVYKRSNISRCFTDIQVIRQHGFANENRFETAAQLLLGLQPDFFPAAL